MATLIQEFLDHLVVDRGLAENTIAAYNVDLHQLQLFLEVRGLTLSQATPELAVSFLDAAGLAGKSLSTIARKRAALRSFYDWMRTTEAIAENPTLTLERPRTPRQVPATLTEAQVERMLGRAALAPRERAVLELLYSGGLRTSELAQVNLADVNLHEGHVRALNKDGKERIVPLSEAALRAVESYLRYVRPTQKSRPQERALILNYAGRRVSRQCIWKIVKHAAHAAGLPVEIAPATLRHSFALHLVARGVDIQSIRELLGHSDLSTTAIYQVAHRASSALEGVAA